jgi:phosphomannomutase
VIKFGTSGFRGIIGDNWTKENIQKIGYSLKQIVMAEKRSVKLCACFDTRFMGRESAVWFTESVACEFIHVTVYTTPTPTPVVTFDAKNDFDYGVAFTASHNPYHYNGFKIFVRGGKEAEDELLDKISKGTDMDKKVPSTPISALLEKGYAVWSNDVDKYIDATMAKIDVAKIKKSGVKVLFNPMHGCTKDIVERMLNNLNVTYKTINGNPDPYFGGNVPAPYKHNLKEQSKMVVKGKYDFGFALDGDGDRVAFIDGDGEIYDCNALVAVFYYYFIEVKKMKGTAVKNFLSSNLIVRLAEKYGYEVIETDIGFKHLGPALEKNDALLAGESHGIAFKDMSLCKDGVFAAFAMIDVIVSMKKGISKIIEEIVDLVNYPSCIIEQAYVYDPSKQCEIEKMILDKNRIPEFTRTVNRIEYFPRTYRVVFEGGYWCSARTSGNEAAVRFFAEMPTEKESKEIIKKLENAYGMFERQK